MASNASGNDEAREEHEHYSKIVDKFMGLSVNASPLKLGEVEELDKLDPKTFLDVEFKNFGQQQDFTKKVFVFCMSRNADVMEAEANERFGPLFKEVKKKKKAKRPKLASGEEEEHEDQYSKPWTWTEAWDASVGTRINWTAELDAIGESVLFDVDFWRAMQQDPNIADEASITLDEGTPREQPSAQLLDDFGATLLDPVDVERELLKGFPFNACFPQHSAFYQHVPRHLGFPETDASHISQVRRDTEENGQTKCSLIESENVGSVRDSRHNMKRTSKSPRQPLTSANVNVTEEGSVALEPIVIEALGQIHLEPLVDPIEMIPVEEVVPEQEVTMQDNAVIQEVAPVQEIIPVQEVDPVHEVVTMQEVPPLQEVALVLDVAQIDTPDQGVVAPPPRIVRVKEPLANHKVSVYGLLKLKRVRFPLVNNDLRDTDDSNLDQHLNEMYKPPQPETMHISDILDEFFTKPSQPFLPPSEANIILRPSDCHVTQPIPRRTSTILHQISESPQPLMPTLANIMQEEQQHLDSMVLTSQEVNNDLLRLQRKIGRTPPRVDLRAIEFVHELPTLDQIRQVEEAETLMSYERNHPNNPLPTHSNTENRQKPEYTEEEKDLLATFFNILTLRSQTGRSTFSLAEVVGSSGNHAHKLATLMKLTWQQPRMVKLIKAPNSNIVTHVQ